MADLMPLVRQAAQWVNGRPPQAWTRAVNAALNTLPTRQVFADVDMLHAVNTTRPRAIDAFWERAEGMQDRLGARRVLRLRSELRIPCMVVIFPLSCGYALTAAVHIGLRATYQAARLARAGQPEAARAVLRENAFEVYMTWRLIENVAVLAACFGLVRVIRAATPLPRWVP